MKIVYFGFNSFKKHKRGVENVIEFQSKAIDFDSIYYLHWDSKTTAYKNNRFACISIKHNWYWPLILNFVLINIRIKKKFIIHSHNPLFSFFSILRTDILTVHDGLYYLNKSKKNKNNPIFKITEIFLYFRCSLVHFISNFTKEQSLFGNKKKFVIIPNTSHFETIAPLSQIHQNVSNYKTILIVRSIEERARFDLLLNVAEKLRSKHFKFTVAGKGPLLDYYQKEITKRDLKNIVMLGYVNDEDLINLYTYCDIVLMIAEYGEGFGLPIIEGYLFNKPVIASNKCAIPEVIISKEYLFENTEDNIINAIEYVLHFEIESYREYYNLKFSNSIVISQFRDIYNNCFSC